MKNYEQWLAFKEKQAFKLKNKLAKVQIELDNPKMAYEKYQKELKPKKTKNESNQVRPAKEEIEQEQDYWAS